MTMARVRDLWFTTDRRRTARHGHGKRWLAVWIGPDSAAHSKAYERKVDAERFVAAVETDMLRGTYVDPRRGSVRIRDYAEDKFLPSLIHLRPNSVDTYASHLRTHVYPLLGDYRIGALGKVDVKAFVAAKTRELAPSTVETVVAILRAMLAAAVEDGVIPVNPCSRVGLPQVAPRVLQPLEPAEVLALQAALPRRYRVAVALGAGAGLRFGEATGLTVPRLYRDLHRIQVLEQAQNNVLAPLKTKASVRTVPVGDWVLAEIAEHLELFGPGPRQLVMSTAHGGFVHRTASPFGRQRDRFGPWQTRSARSFQIPRHRSAHRLLQASLRGGVLRVTGVLVPGTQHVTLPGSQDLRVSEPSAVRSQ